MKIAVIGSGISGMASAHILARNHEVHLFESATRLGGHTDTHQVEVASGRYRVDTGFIVFNNKNYPNFIKLMDQLGVKSQPSEMSFSVKVEKNGLEYNGTNLNSLFCQRRNLFNFSFYQMIRDILRFNKEATHHYLNHQLDHSKTIEDFLRENKYSPQFIEHYIIPMGAAIWSASREEMRKFPLGFFVRFFYNHGMLTVDDRPLWRVIQNGSQSYIPALTKNFSSNIHLGEKIHLVKRLENKVMVQSSTTSMEFDHVVFAAHADQVMKIFENPTPLEREVMSAFKYRPNDVTLHTDTSILPKSELGHAAWNYYLPAQERERVAVSYHMNILQGIKAPEKFLVSLNMNDLIDPAKVIKKIDYDHPVYSLEAVAAQQKWAQISGQDHIHFCGAYWGNGFHEDGVVSAVNVAKSFGMNL
jgi:uncharacterized protein